MNCSSAILFFLLTGAIFITSCKTHKKTQSPSSASGAPLTVNTITDTSTLHKPVNIGPSMKPADGIYEPGEHELNAIKPQFPDASLEKLKKGYLIYSKGACLNCHGSVNIYQIADAQWKSIAEDMSHRAALTDADKDAVYKYVLSIKAAQTK